MRNTPYLFSISYGIINATSKDLLNIILLQAISSQTSFMFCKHAYYFFFRDTTCKQILLTLLVFCVLKVVVPNSLNVHTLWQLIWPVLSLE